MRCVLLFFVTVLCGQSQFDVQSRLVMVPVTVGDAKGRRVDGLEASNFVVSDNGRRREITVDTFATGVAPIALVVAIQSSGISEPALEKVRRVGSMIQPLITGERGCAAVMAFDDTLHWLQSCTNDPELIGRAFAGVRPGSPKIGRMLDAVDKAIDHLRQRQNARRVLLLISESRDRGSENGLEPVVLRAQAAGVAVYAITYSALKSGFATKTTPNIDPPREDPKKPRATRTEPLSPRGRVPIPPPEYRVDILGGIGELNRLGKVKTTEALARATGGAEFSFARLKGLESAIEKLGAEIHSQYVLSFIPTDAEPGYHELRVEIPTLRDARIRARPAYWVADKPASTRMP